MTGSERLFHLFWIFIIKINFLLFSIINFLLQFLPCFSVGEWDHFNRISFIISQRHYFWSQTSVDFSVTLLWTTAFCQTDCSYSSWYCHYKCAGEDKKMISSGRHTNSSLILTGLNPDIVFAAQMHNFKLVLQSKALSPIVSNYYLSRFINISVPYIMKATWLQLKTLPHIISRNFCI